MNNDEDPSMNTAWDALQDVLAAVFLNQLVNCISLITHTFVKLTFFFFLSQGESKACNKIIQI